MPKGFTESSCLESETKHLHLDGPYSNHDRLKVWDVVLIFFAMRLLSAADCTELAFPLVISAKGTEFQVNDEPLF